MNIKNRDIVKSIILSLVTCGIYGIYWIVRVVKEAVTVNNASDSGVLEILFTIFLPFIGFFLTEKKFAEGCAAQGIEHTENALLYLVIGLIPILGVFGVLFLFQSELNKIANIIG